MLRLVEAYGGEIPRTMEDLLSLPGVAARRRTLILGNRLRKQDGIVVDTHVGRVTRRLGLTRHDDPSRSRWI